MKVNAIPMVAFSMMFSSPAWADDTASSPLVLSDGNINPSLNDDFSILASAPRGIRIEELGRPYSSNMEPLVGVDGRSMFPSAKKPRSTTVNEFMYYSVDVRNSHEFRANAAAWGMLSVGGEKFGSNRYFSYRAVQITDVYEIDDLSSPREVPTGAAYYVRKIYFGRMLEVLVTGSASMFNAQARAQFAVWNGRVSDFTSRYHLSSTMLARGLQPRAELVFARSPDEVRQSYVEDKKNYGKPVPILIEYRRLPRTALIGYNEMPVEDAQPSAMGILRHKVEIDSRNDDWQSTGITLAWGDVVSIEAFGLVTLSGNGLQSRPERRQEGNCAFASGTLQLKVGSEDPLFVGNSGVYRATTNTGDVKLRVYDNKYSDNKGSYTVELVYIPSAWLPEPAPYP